MKYYTHSGLFHCDEVTGYAIVLLAGECTEFERLTDITNLPNDGIIADIGREYNPDKKRFDHHQGLILRDNSCPYASAGLLWKAFGKKVVKSVEPSCRFSADVAQRVDETLIQGIDAHDADNTYKVTASGNCEKVRVMTLPNIVSTYNYHDVHNHEVQFGLFRTASMFVARIIKDAVNKANQFIEDKEDFKRIAQIEGCICILPRPIMWKEIVHESYPFLQYVISPSMHPGNPYSMIAVPVEPESREVKTPIERPDWFDGFIHQGKWIAGANTIDELKKLAKYNL